MRLLPLRPRNALIASGRSTPNCFARGGGYGPDHGIKLGFKLLELASGESMA